jgi:hypothetical protein
MRYQDPSAETENLFTQIISNNFPALEGVTFRLLFDTKKRVSKGNITISSTDVSNEKVKFLSSDDMAPEGYDCIMVIDSLAWQYASEADRRRIISHELNHIVIDEKGKLKSVGHDVEDFANEINKNVDDPTWASKLAILTRSIYEQQEDQQGEVIV